MSSLKLTGVCTFIMLSFFSTYGYAISDGTVFYFKNNTSEEYVIHQGGKNWFNSFPDTVIPPHKTVHIYLEGSCFHPHAQEDAITNVILFNKNDPNKVSEFRLVVINAGAVNCVKRIFRVNGQYRKIELAPKPIGAPSTPTPHFRFTIVGQGQNSVLFVQEGPRDQPFADN